MTLTSAEKQRRYRERKKQQDPTWLEREKKRVSRSRKTVLQLSASALDKRREQGREWSQTHREKVKLSTESKLCLT